VEGGLGRGETRNATRSLCDVVCDDGENGPGRRIGSHTRRPSGSWCGRRALSGCCGLMTISSCPPSPTMYTGSRPLTTPPRARPGMPPAVRRPRPGVGPRASKSS
jgi:hypothetical protein